MENKNDWKFLQEEVANIAREGLIRYGINPDTVTLADVEHNEKLRRLAMLSGAIVPKKTSISEDIEKANEDPILWYEYTEQQHRKCKVRGAMLIYAMFNDDKCRLTPLQKDFVNRLTARIGDPLKVARVLYLGKLDATAHAGLSFGAWFSVVTALLLLISVPVWWTMSKKKAKEDEAI